MVGSEKTTTSISKEEVPSLTDKWKFAVVGQAFGNIPSIYAVKRFTETNWSSKGLLEVEKIENEVFVFRFQSEDSKQLALEQSPLLIGGEKILVLSPWNPLEPVPQLSFDSAPVWIKLRGLGLQYFCAEILSGLGSLIGTPLCMDRCTTDQRRMAFARILVEVQAGEKLPNEIHFTDEYGRKRSQKVEYESFPPRCLFCNAFGHRTKGCQKKVRPETMDGASGSKAQLDQQNGLVDDLVSNTRLLESKTQEEKSKKDTPNASAQSAETANEVSEMLENINPSSSLSAFVRMEDKVVASESEAEALNQLSTDELAGKFSLLESCSVDDDVAALKKELYEGSKKRELPPEETPNPSASSSFPFQDSEIEKN